MRKPMPNDFITTVFVLVDDFCKIYAEYIRKRVIESNSGMHRKPTRVPEITESEIITIMLLYQRVGGRDFKSFYNYHLKESFKSAFPKLPTYERFIELRKRILPIMEALMYCILKKNSDKLRPLKIEAQQADESWRANNATYGYLKREQERCTKNQLQIRRSLK